MQKLVTNLVKPSLPVFSSACGRGLAARPQLSCPPAQAAPPPGKTPAWTEAPRKRRQAVLIRRRIYYGGAGKLAFIRRRELGPAGRCDGCETCGETARGRNGKLAHCGRRGQGPPWLETPRRPP